jgi:Mrp family chromosome partitioning ATPase
MSLLKTAGRPWYDALLEALVRHREPASRSYRYMSRLIERSFDASQGGVCLAFSATDGDRPVAAAMLLLAHCLQSELDCRVLLVDARLREPQQGLTGRLGLGGAEGCAELLRKGVEGLESVIRPTAVQHVDFLPAGLAQLDAAVEREAVSSLLAAARQRYRFVLVQIGSVLLDTRNVVVASQADAVFLLAHENATLMKSLQRCHEVLGDNGVTDVRVVLTSQNA